MVPWLVFGGYCVAVVWAGWIAWRARAAVADPHVPERAFDAPELALLRGRGRGTDAVAACVGGLLLREELVAVPGGVTFNDLTVRDGAFTAREPDPDATPKPLDRVVRWPRRGHTGWAVADRGTTSRDCRSARWPTHVRSGRSWRGCATR
ncbi:hypothetical protein [Streptomyces griseus]|uniref:hypothetical protein n=1 Tax=Streptomyces griseus TaxID=1911 RepID=UPI0004C9BB22|nr:hypothetical protein [Streptomyces griseus]